VGVESGSAVLHGGIECGKRIDQAIAVESAIELADGVRRDVA
jgi:hypothetical protein